MSFLFPLFLAAGAAILAPLLLHLRRQPPTKVTEFSSLLFLDTSPQVTTTKRRLERWLLLLLRCLVLLILALMFARPYNAAVTTQATAGTGKALVILLDESASMSRAELWKEATERLLEVISSLTPQDRITLATFDTEAHQKIPFRELDAMGPAERAAQIRSVLAQVKPTQGATRIDHALITATTWLDETRTTSDATVPLPSSREIILISDLQEGASLAALNTFTWPQDVTLTIEQITTDAIDNRALALAAADDSASDEAEMIRLRLTNAPEADTASFTLRMDEDPTPLAAGEIPSGATRILRVPRPKDDKPHTFKLSDDDWPLDNVVYLAPHQPKRIRIAALGNQAKADDASQPFYYLQRALQPTRHLIPEFHIIDSDAPGQWHQPDWLVILPENLPPALQSAARRSIEDGSRALLLATAGTNAASLEKLTGHRFTLSEAEVKNYALIAELQTEHPALEPFRDPRLSDLSRIHIWHHRTFEDLPPHATTLMKFDDRSPALLELPVGKGIVHLLTTGWHPKDSQLAHSPHFIALLDGLLSQIPGTRPVEQQLLTGERIPSGHAVQNTTGHFIATVPYAVNLPPQESRLTPHPLSAFTAAGVTLQNDDTTATDPQQTLRLEHEALEARQQYWLILLAALLWVIGLETWLAGRPTSPPREVTQARTVS